MRIHVSADGMEMHPRQSYVARMGFKDWRTLPRPHDGRTRVAHWLTLLCLGLIFLSGTIQAEHVHPASPGSVDTHAACSLCVTAHVGTESAATPLLHLAAKVIGHAEPRRADTAFAAPQYFDLYTRPPPTDPTLA